MNLLKLLINKWVILFLIAFCPAVKVFFVDAYEAFIDIATMDLKSEPTLNKGNGSEIRQVLFSKERNNLRHVKLSDIALISKSTDQAEISAKIRSEFPGNDFPILVAAIRNKNGDERQVEVKPTDYKHSDKFTEEVVTLRINLMPGDAKFQVTAKY